MNMQVQERVTKLQSLVGVLPISEDYITHPNEIPWWHIEDPIERSKARNRQRKRMWDKLHPGYGAKASREFCNRHPEYFAEAKKKSRNRHPGHAAEVMRVWRENHPGAACEAMKRYDERHPGALSEIRKEFFERHPGFYTNYYKTPKGRAHRAKTMATRREHSTDPALYAARIELLHTMQEPCAKCHATYDITHQIDHVLALCLGGTDNWSNLQPICVLCHRKKSAEDMRKLVALANTKEVTVRGE